MRGGLRGRVRGFVFLVASMSVEIPMRSFSSAYSASVARGSLWQVLDPITVAARSYRVWFYTTCVLAAIVTMCALFAVYSIGELVHISGAGSEYKTSTSIILGLAGAGILTTCGFIYVDFTHNDFSIMTGLMTLYATLSDSVHRALDSVPVARAPELCARFGAGIASIADIKSVLLPRLAPRRVNSVVLGAGACGVLLVLAAFLVFASNYMTALFIGLVGVCLIFAALMVHKGIHAAGYRALLRDTESLRTLFVGDDVAAYYIDAVAKVCDINARYNAQHASLLQSSQLLADASQGARFR